MSGKVLLTGGTGFIGRWAIAPLLRAGHDVHLVVTHRDGRQDLPAGIADKNIHQLDLFDQQAVHHVVQNIAPSHLLHFAWDARPGLYWTSTENFRWVEASLNLLRAFHASGGRRTVFAGSCAEYDWDRAQLCTEYATPLAGQAAPASPYAICKNALRAMQASFGSQTGLSCAWGRIFFLYGPYERPARLVPSIIQSVLAGTPALCSHGRQLRNFLLASDVAAAFVALLDSDVTGAVNIGSTEHVTIGALANAIGSMLERPRSGSAWCAPCAERRAGNIDT